MTRTWLLGCILLLGLAAASAALALQSDVVSVTVHCPSLEGNQLGASADRTVAIYLPPGYDAAGAVHYPVICLLHRLGGNEHGWWSAASSVAMDTVAVADKLVGTHAIQAVILALPNAATPSGVCFDANTPVCGSWEDFVTRDVVVYVDAHYRTLAGVGRPHANSHARRVRAEPDGPARPRSRRQHAGGLPGRRAGHAGPAP